MSISGIFIRRPVMTTLVMLGIVVFGVVGYRTLPVSDLPNVDFPTIQVSAGLPGASPEMMAASIATPLERQFSTIPGVDSMTSTSTMGSTNVTIQFSLERNLDAAAQDVQTAIAAAQRRLPPGMPSPPTLRKVNPADQPILMLSLNSQTLPLSTVDEYAEGMIAQRISMISGVAQVSVYGAMKFAVRAQVDPILMASRGIALSDVATAIGKHNVNLPTGTLWGPRQAFTVQATGQLTNAEGYRPLIVAYRNGAPVRLEELGRVIDSVQNDKSAAWFNNARSITLTIQRQPGTNTVAVVDAVKQLLPSFRELLPPSVKMDVLIDRSESIRESVDDVKLSLMLTVVLVVFVIFLFLRNISATVIPSLALPLSIIGTFAAMALLGYTLDNLSLMALTLSVAFVADDAIVVLENIVRHMEQGKDRLQAALDGAKEIGFTVVSMTLSLAAVFVPVLFMSGIMGRLFHEFAVVISVAILISGSVALSLTPMLASRILKPEHENESAFHRVTEGVFQGARNGYAWTLRGVLRYRFLALVVAAGTLVATVYISGLVPMGFIPSQDTGTLSGTTEAPQDISFDGMSRAQKQAADILLANPDIAAIASSLGAGGGSSANNAGRFNIRLKPRSERQSTPEQIIESLRPKLNALPGIRTYLQNPPLVRIGGMMTRSLYQYTLQGPDVAELYRVGAQFEKQMRTVPGLEDVSSDLQLNNPQVTVKIDRERASALNVTADSIEDALYSAYGARQVSSIYTPVDVYYVILEVLPQYQNDPNGLGLLYIKSANGRLVPLNEVATLETGVGPLAVAHYGQLPAVTYSFNLRPGVSLGQAVDAVQQAAREHLPANISTTFQGTAAAYQSSLQGMGALLVLAILIIYMVLGILYESFIHPITILSSLPSAGLGALATLLFFKQELNIYSFVGVIMLVGIVQKYSIMMIDFALGQRQQGVPPAEAIYQACLVRFRPILMTSVAALMGTLPIALGVGAGSEARRPLGLAVEGGLLVSVLLTLYITPVMFLYLEQASVSLSRRRATRKTVVLEEKVAAVAK
jgi:hydrophobic/amphiphilic exporter-1 (mainly G- bacteria), HAE1 family